MLGPLRTSVLLLPLLAAALWAAPLTKYDQRQDGELNVHAHLENFVILLIPGGLRGFNIAAKVAPGRVHDRKHVKAVPGRVASVETHPAVPAVAPSGVSSPPGLKAPPYQVDIDQRVPIILEITAPRLSEEQHEVVIAESPTVVLAKKPQVKDSEKILAEQPQGHVDSPPKAEIAPLAKPQEDPAKAEEEQVPNATPAPENDRKTPSRIAENPKRPSAPTVVLASAPVSVPVPAEKPKKPAVISATPVVADKPKRPAAAPAVVHAVEKPKRPAVVVAAPAAPAAASALPAADLKEEPAPASEAAEAPAEAPAVAESSEAPTAAGENGPKELSADAKARAVHLAALTSGMEPHPAAATPCEHGPCLRNQAPVRIRKIHHHDSAFLRALSFGLGPAH